MMIRKDKRRRKRKFDSFKPKPCSFCKNKTEPDYKEPETLARFMTDRGKIISRSRGGACARHQRLLTRQIKRARYLALLPFLAKARK